MIRDYFERKNGKKNTVSGGTWTLVMHPQNENVGFMYTSCKADMGEAYPAEFKGVLLMVKNGKVDTYSVPMTAEQIQQQKKEWGV